MTKKRTYKMTARARSKEETRQKIVEAAMHLHETLGPRATSISAIAERAGVQRLTVYRHFEDETAIFEACTSHWLGLNPPPSPEDWAGMEGGADRVAAAVRAFYDYYAGTRSMWEMSYRDVDDVVALQPPMNGFLSYMAQVVDDLASSMGGDTGDLNAVRVTLGHIISFPAWLDLEKRGLDTDAKYRLVMRWFSAVVAPDG